jgi:SAM-dependent methyltransferase
MAGTDGRIDSSIESILVCPACRARLQRGDQVYLCPECETGYPIREGIPLLLNSDRATGEDEPMQRQRDYFDRDSDTEFEITRPHGTPRLHQWLLDEKFRRSTSDLRNLLEGALVLSVCGGSGMDAEFLARAGARVILVDVSLGAAKRAQQRAERFGLSIMPVVADATCLPFAAQAVDVAYVHDGLHHLDRPIDGLREMCRVASRAISLTEPAQAAVTAAAVRLGLALEEEEAGNKVARLSSREIAAELQREGFRVRRAERYGMYYRHRPGKAVRWLSAGPAFELATTGFSLLNRLGGRFGNKLTVQALRENDRKTGKTS